MTKSLFDRTDDPATAWVSMLPVVSEPGLYQTEVSMRLNAQSPWRLEITPEGKADPIFQFDPKPEKNEPILANLPGMYWHFPVTRAPSPAATVLARTATRACGTGTARTCCSPRSSSGPAARSSSASTARTAGATLSEQHFDGFWGRLIDRAGRGKQLGGRYPYTLSADRAGYRPGSLATIAARFDNLAELDAGIDVLNGEVEVGDRPPVPVTLTPRAGERGVFEASFPVTHAGPHFVRVWPGEADPRGGVAKAATMQFDVELPNLEYERPGVDFAALKQIANITGGAVFDASQAEQIAAAFRVKQVARMLEDRQEIWDAPLLFGTVLLALFAEWVLRKKYRLV